MELFQNMALGFDYALSGTALLYCFSGVFLGTLIGVLPGVGTLAAVSLLMPVSFYLDPTSAIVMLAGVYYGAEYGGSTASILLNLPGTPANTVTCLDGYPMTQQGRAGVALLITTLTSFFGGTIGILAMMFVTPLVVSLALSFGPIEYVAVIGFSLIATATMVGSSPVKGLMMVLAGLALGTVGLDVNSGVPRFDLGRVELFEGFSVAVVAMGLFGVAEIIASVNAPRMKSGQKVNMRSMVPTRDDLRRSILPSVRGTFVGMLFGPLPGTGATVASPVSYVLEKRLARDPSRFGKGAVEGIASPEAANNAAVQTAFIPTLALGIPGTATMAIILGALMIHGINPGPRLVVDHPDLFWGLIASFWVGNLLLLVLNIPLIGIWVSVLSVPYKFLYPIIVALLCIGSYSIHLGAFDVGLLLCFGLAGYFLKRAGFEAAPLLIGFILGPIFEENLRRALLLSKGDFSVFFTNTLSLVLGFLAIVLVIWSVVSASRGRRLATS